MAMTLDDILQSGLLELYVLGQLTEEEIREVEAAIAMYPQLKSEVFEIEQALFKYDRLFKTPAPTDILTNILANTKTDSNTNSKTRNGGLNWPKLLITVLGLSLLAGVFYYNQKTIELEKTINDQLAVIQNCDEENAKYAEQLRIHDEILEYESKKIFITPNEKYQNTELIIHNNPAKQKNYLQINTLPPLASNQSFQLWSLKGNNPPIPLDVFEDDVDQLLEIQFVENTNAYAITIEPRGGQDTPTLENLIGIFNVIS